jgi:hypothetical protein
MPEDLWGLQQPTKQRLAKRIRLKMPDVIIFDEVLKIFRAVVERDKLVVISKEAARDVRRTALPVVASAEQGDTRGRSGQGYLSSLLEAVRR